MTTLLSAFSGRKLTKVTESEAGAFQGTKYLLFHISNTVASAKGKVGFSPKRCVHCCKYLELPKFTKNVDELQTNFERWVYLLKKLPSFENHPPELKGKIFDMLFRAADISQLTPKEMEEYKKNITDYADVQDAIVYYMEKGREEGLKEEKIEIAKSCLIEGLPVETIAKITGLSLEQIKQLQFDICYKTN